MPQKVNQEFKARESSHKGRPRSPEQVEVDNDVAEALGGDKVLTYQVTPEEYDTTVKRVRAATALHNVTGVLGADRPGNRKGTVLLQFRFRDRIHRPRKPVAE